MRKDKQKKNLGKKHACKVNHYALYNLIKFFFNYKKKRKEKTPSVKRFYPFGFVEGNMQRDAESLE